MVPQGSTSHSLYRAGSASLALIFSGKPLQRLDMRSGFSVLIQMPCPPSSPSKKKDICSLLFPRHGKSTELSHTHLLTLLTWKSAVQMTAFSASQYERPALVPLSHPHARSTTKLCPCIPHFSSLHHHPSDPSLHHSFLDNYNLFLIGLCSSLSHSIPFSTQLPEPSCGQVWLIPRSSWRL